MKVQLLFALLLCLTIAQKSYSSSAPTSQEPSEFPEADVYSLKRDAQRNQNSNENEGKVIKSASQQTRATPIRSPASLFTRLPSSSQLDEIVLSADTVVILKTVQVVVSDDSLPCSQQVDYLLQLLGRIRSAIEKKQFAANQLQVIINGAAAQIQRLEAEIDRLEDEKKSFWLDELRSKLAKLVRELEACYRQFNAVESQIAPNEARVAGYEKQIQILMKSSDEERNRIANDKLKLVEVEALIRDLENQLNNANNRRNALKQSIARSEKTIEENDEKIRNARAKIDELEKQIGALRDKADQIRRKCTELEIQVERLRTDIAVAESKTQRIDDQIDQLNERINIERKKLVSDDLNSLNNMIKSLMGMIGGVQREIDRQYYYCYGEGAVQVQETGSVVIYIVRGESFGNYLLNAYGQSVNVSLRTDLQFYVVDIFSASWTASFGASFSSSSRNGNNLSLNGDFSCANPSSSVSGSGRISRIRGNRIEVSGDQGTTHLNLGACSRVESTQRLPRVGQNIAYRAAASSGGHNVHSATCW